MSPFNRRKFLKDSGILWGASLIPHARPYGNLDLSPVKERVLKIGLIGCGGRGTGAAAQALKADSKTILYSLGDIFKDKLESSRQILAKAHPEKIDVNERCFVGFDAFQRVIDSGVDVVILATPPKFRPLHLTTAVDSGKHVFCEKPVAVDGPGIRQVLEASLLAKEKKLSIVSGFCFRYDFAKRACFKKINQGDIGEIRAIYNTCNVGEIWSIPRQPGWTDAEAQFRNWYYYTWLSGDHIVEQAIHAIDMMNWAMGDRYPVAAVGTGGRQVRTGKLFGNIFDHFAIAYEFENGAKGFHLSRQQKNCLNSNLIEALGTTGTATIDAFTGKTHRIESNKNIWDYEGPVNNMYQTQHDELFHAIRSENPINNGKSAAHSTLCGIMGRMAAYSGQRITFLQALHSTDRLGIDECDFDMVIPEQKVARPGFTTVN